MIYLYGHGGSMNHGCEALVRSTVQMFRWPSVLFSANREQDEAYKLQDLLPVYQDIGKNLTKPSLYYYLSAVEIKTKGTTVLHSRYAHANLLSAVKKGDICLSIGGDNYCYAGVEKIADLNYLLHKKGARTVLWGCSIEPEVLTPAVVKDLNRYDLITVRESLTFHALEKAGVQAKRILCADPAFQLECIEKTWPSDWPKGDFIGINVSPLILSYEQQQGITLQNYTNLIRTILTETDCAVLLIPHVVVPSNDDRKPLKMLYDQFRESGRVVMLEDCNCMELKGYIARCRMFIGARTHATIAAYSTGVPTLVVGYSVKARGIARDLFGTEEGYVLPVQKLQHPDDLTKAFRWLMQKESEIRTHLQEVMPLYRQKAGKAADALKKLMKEH